MDRTTIYTKSRIPSKTHLWIEQQFTRNPVNSFFEVLLTRAKDVRVETPEVFPVNNPQIYLGVVEALT
ncbi:MAG: hypothetical protein LBS25_07605, partial [Candidatus Symbiothrix sp.]|nr:hypothetical protein [Candidatus Symbiothrix sp.]